MLRCSRSSPPARRRRRSTRPTPRRSSPATSSDIAPRRCSSARGDEAPGRARRRGRSGMPVHELAARRRASSRARTTDVRGRCADARRRRRSRCSCTRAARRAGRSCVPLRQRNLAASARTIAATYGLARRRRQPLRDAALPRARARRPPSLAHALGGGAVVAARALQRAARSGRTRPDARRHVVLGRADDPPDASSPAQAERGRPRARAALRPLVLVGAAGAAVMARVRGARSAIPLVEAYGMTEAAHQMTSNPLPPGERRGRARSGVRDRRRDRASSTTTGTRSRRASAARSSVRGPAVVDGYRDNPEANAASFRDGWFRTGDRGDLSADGYLSLDGTDQGADQPRRREDLAATRSRTVLLAHPPSPRRPSSASRRRSTARQVGAAVVLRGDASSATSSRPTARERLAPVQGAERIVRRRRDPEGADRQGAAPAAGRASSS